LSSSIESSRRFLMASYVGVVSRVVSVGSRLVTLPLMLSLLDTERYGLWLLLTSFLSWLSLTDMGIPSALQNPLAAAIAGGKMKKAEELVTDAFGCLCKISIVSAVAGVIFFLIFPLGDWLNIDNANRREFMMALVFLAGLLAVTIPLRIGSIVAYASSQAILPPIWDIASQAISLVLLVFFWYIRYDSLFALLIAVNVVQLVVSLSLLYSACKRCGITLSYSAIVNSSWSRSKELLSSGFLFLFVLIGEGLILQSDGFLIGAIVGPSLIPGFLVPFTLIIQFFLLQNAFLRPMWSVFTIANSSGDFITMRALVRKGLIISLIAALIFGAGLVLFGNLFLTFWTNGKVSISSTMAIGFAALVVISALCNFLALFCNAVGMVKHRLVGVLLYGVMKIAVGAWCLNYMTLEFMPLSYAICALFTDGLVLFVITKRFFSSRCGVSSFPVIAKI
jgi:O-antigen/teichoic acid export membrane protein